MRSIILFFSFSLILISCGEKKAEIIAPEPTPEVMTKEDSLVAKKDSLEIESDYDMSTVPEKGREEFIDNLAKIEDEYGMQWDFCKCSITQDSIDKAFKNVNISDSDFDKVYERSNYVDDKCRAFFSQSADITPDQREAHARKVKACLKAAGIK